MSYSELHTPANKAQLVTEALHAISDRLKTDPNASFPLGGLSPATAVEKVFGDIARKFHCETPIRQPGLNMTFKPEVVDGLLVHLERSPTARHQLDQLTRNQPGLVRPLENIIAIAKGTELGA